MKKKWTYGMLGVKGIKRTLCCLVFLAPVAKAELTQDQFKQGYIAHEILRQELITVDYMVNQCQARDPKVGPQLIFRYPQWNKRNEQIRSKMADFKDAMYEMISQQGTASMAVKKSALDSVERGRTEQFLSGPRDTFSTADPQLINTLCSSVKTMFDEVSSVRKARPKEYDLLMSLEI